MCPNLCTKHFFPHDVTLDVLCILICISPTVYHLVSWVVLVLSLSSLNQKYVVTHVSVVVRSHLFLDLTLHGVDKTNPNTRLLITLLSIHELKTKYIASNPLTSTDEQLATE